MGTIKRIQFKRIFNNGVKAHTMCGSMVDIQSLPAE